MRNPLLLLCSAFKALWRKPKENFGEEKQYLRELDKEITTACEEQEDLIVEIETARDSWKPRDGGLLEAPPGRAQPAIKAMKK